MHVQMLGEAYPFRELLPLNFFLTAVRAWRPIVHLSVFVFESQKKKYCTLSNVRYRKKLLSITLSVSLFSLLYIVMFEFYNHFLLLLTIRICLQVCNDKRRQKNKNHKIKYFNFVFYSV